MTDRFEGRLSEYRDGDLTGRERRLMERHLETCGECAGTLAELRAVAATAAALGDREPPRDLWPEIERRILAGDEGAEEGDVAGGPGGFRSASGPRSGRRSISFTLPQLAAAAVALASVSAAGAWLAWGSDSSSRAPGGLPPGDPGVVAVSSAEAGFTEPGFAERYAEEVAELERVLFDSDSPLPQETAARVRKALITIDRALEDARRALQRAPEDPYLRQHLTNTMQRKTEFLRQTVRLAQG